jgi:hypothetical protein
LKFFPSLRDHGKFLNMRNHVEIIPWIPWFFKTFEMAAVAAAGAVNFAAQHAQI